MLTSWTLSVRKSSNINCVSNVLTDNSGAVGDVEVAVDQDCAGLIPVENMRRWPSRTRWMVCAYHMHTGDCNGLSPPGVEECARREFITIYII